MEKNARASKKQQELLQFVDGFIKGNGYGPSYREIMRALGYKSVSTVAVHVEGLIAKGYLRRQGSSARSLEVVSLREQSMPMTQTISEHDDVRQRVENTTLSNEEKQTVLKALELLGYDDIAKTLAERS